MNDSRSTEIYKTVLIMGVGYVLALSMGTSFTPKLCKDSSFAELHVEKGWRRNKIKDSPLPLFEKLNHFLKTCVGGEKTRGVTE